MSWRTTGLSVLILLAFLAIRIPNLLSRPSELHSSWLLPPSHDDPEGRLAMGLKLPLRCVNMWSVELIKGVSDNLAFELLDKRVDIIRAAINGSQMEAIQKAHGIGEKTAAQLLKYLDLTERCEVQDTLEIWRKASPQR